MKNMTIELRLLFINVTVISVIGIGLTGYEHMHWFVYVLPAALLFAAASGYCIGLDIIKRLLRVSGLTAKGVSVS